MIGVILFAIPCLAALCFLFLSIYFDAQSRRWKRNFRSSEVAYASMEADLISKRDQWRGRAEQLHDDRSLLQQENAGLKSANARLEQQLIDRAKENSKLMLASARNGATKAAGARGRPRRRL